MTDQERQQDIANAYREVLGRNPDAGGLDTYMKAGLTGDKLKRELAGSIEASTKKGLDPTKYGVKVHDPAKMSEAQRREFELLKKKHGVQHLTTAMWKVSKGMEHAFRTDEARAQYDSGNITMELTNNGPQFRVSDNAVRALGSDLSLHLASTPGAGFIYPSKINIGGVEEAVTLTDARFSDAQDLGEYGMDGYSYTARIDKPGQGLFQEVGDFLGVSDDVIHAAAIVGGLATGGVAGFTLAGAGAQGAGANAGIDESYFLVDPLNIGTGLMHGAEGQQMNVEAGSRLTGLDVDSVSVIQGIGRAVTSLAAGPIAGLAVTGLSQASSAQANRQSWSDAFTNTGIAAAGQALMLVPGAQGLGMAGTLFANAAVSGATTFAQGRLTGGMSEAEAFEAAAISAGTSALTSGVNHVLDVNGALAGATVGSLSGAFSAAVAGGDIGWGAAQGAAEGAYSGAQRRGRNEQFAVAQDIQTQNIEAYRDWVQQDQLGGWGYDAPGMPQPLPSHPDNWQDRAKQLYSFDGTTQARPAFMGESFYDPPENVNPAFIFSPGAWAVEKGVSALDKGLDWLGS